MSEGSNHLFFPGCWNSIVLSQYYYSPLKLVILWYVYINKIQKWGLNIYCSCFSLHADGIRHILVWVCMEFGYLLKVTCLLSSEKVTVFGFTCKYPKFADQPTKFKEWIPCQNVVMYYQSPVVGVCYLIIILCVLNIQNYSAWWNEQDTSFLKNMC